jgi:hypothetical protein
MRIACLINEATNTHYGILITFLLQQMLHDRAPVLRYTCIACLVLSSLKTEHKTVTIFHGAPTNTVHYDTSDEGQNGCGHLINVDLGI